MSPPREERREHPEEELGCILIDLLLLSDALPPVGASRPLPPTFKELLRGGPGND